MLGPTDEFPIHQVPQPISWPGSSDRNFYDRSYYNAHDRTGDIFLVTGIGYYPNLGVKDAFTSRSRATLTVAALAIMVMTLVAALSAEATFNRVIDDPALRAKPYDMSVQAISQHLEVLTGAGLVTSRREGRYKFHFIDTAPLRRLTDRWRGRETKEN